MQCVLLGERHHDLSDGVRGLLESVFAAVFMVSDAVSLVEGAARIQPDLAIVDLAFAGGDLPALLSSLRSVAPSTKVLLLSDHDESFVAHGALAAGADGLILKREIATQLLPAVDALRAGGQYTFRSARNRPSDSFPHSNHLQP